MTLRVSNIQPISINADGMQPIFSGDRPGSTSFQGLGFSPDGTKIIFASFYSNLVVGDTNDAFDVFIKDLTTGEVTLMSASEAGVKGDTYSASGQISPDGSKIIFFSYASNLVADDTNNESDIFIKDLATGEVTLVSANEVGVQGDSASYDAKFSSDGSKVVFGSFSTNFVEGDTNDASDLFVKDLATGEVILVSKNAAGVQGDSYSYDAQFSPDGSKIVFTSSASNLVEGDTNAVADIFIKDLTTGEITLVSSNEAGVQDAQFSPDGSRVLFTSYVFDLTTGAFVSSDIFIKDLATGLLTQTSTNEAGVQGDGLFLDAHFTPDGSKIIFVSDSSNLVESDTNDTYDVFVKDLATGTVTRISTSELGVQGDEFSYNAQISPDGTKVIFASYASNLVPNDTNNSDDIFIATLTEDARNENGTSASETLLGTSSSDTIYAGAGDDVVAGGSGADSIEGGLGRDFLYGEEGADLLAGQQGDDILTGGSGNDTLYGGTGNDFLHGEADNDLLYGNDGNDILTGDGGNDTIIAGYGKDTLSGGEGADVFVFEAATDSIWGWVDTITDFQVGIDKIDLSALPVNAIEKTFALNSLDAVRVLTWEGDTYITHHQSNFEVRLDGNLTAQITEADFIFG